MRKPIPQDLNSRGARRREKIFNVPPVILILFLICCFFYVIPSYFFSAGALERFLAFFSFVPVLFLHNYDVLTQFSAVSYAFLHGNLIHLAMNMLWLIIFGAPLANRLGAVFFIIFWVFTAFAAAMAYCLLNPADDSMLIGASGAISGMMGASARYNFQAIGGAYAPGTILSIKQALTSRAVLIALGCFIALNLLTAADQGQMSFAQEDANIAWQAHLGGLLAGFFAIGFFDKWTHKFTLS